MQSIKKVISMISPVSVYGHIHTHSHTERHKNTYITIDQGDFKYFKDTMHSIVRYIELYFISIVSTPLLGVFATTCPPDLQYQSLLTYGSGVTNISCEFLLVMKILWFKLASVPMGLRLRKQATNKTTLEENIC